MIIFYDPNTNDQIKAVYSHDTTSTVWADRGFVRLPVTNPAHVEQIEVGGLDLRAVVIGGVLDDLESWPRPALVASLNPMPADGVAVCVITATFADPEYGEAVEFRVGGGPPMVVAAIDGVAVLEFGPVEVPGGYEIWCTSPTYGRGSVVVEAADA